MSELFHASFINVELYKSNRKEFFTSLHKYIKAILDTNGIKPTSKKGRELIQFTCTIMYNTIANDPVLYFTAFRADLGMLIDWIEEPKKEQA